MSVSIEKFESTKVASLDAQAFRAAILSALPCVDFESTRYSLCNVFLEFNQGKLHIVGTDGRRLTVTVADCNADESFAALLPYKSAKQIARAITKTVCGLIDLQFAADGLTAQFVNHKHKRVEFSAELPEGYYPNWRDTIPSKPTGKLTGKLDDMRYEFSADSWRAMDIDLNGKATLGRTREASALKYSGKPINATFDYSFFSDFLESLALSDGAPVTIEFSKANSPALLTAGNSRCVVMPLCRDN